MPGPLRNATKVSSRAHRGRPWPEGAGEQLRAMEASPANRRQAAVAGWARDNGVTAEGHKGVDWNRLRAWGLCG